MKSSKNASFPLFKKGALLLISLAGGIVSSEATFTIFDMDTFSISQGDTVNLFGGTLNLQGNALIVKTPGAGGSASYATIYANTAAGANAGSWNGAATLSTGVINSSTAAGGSGITAIGTADNSTPEFQLATFLGVPVPLTASLQMYTWAGDLDLNGVINNDDISIFSDGVNNMTSDIYSNGDVDYSGTINNDDISIFSDAFNGQSGALPSFVDGGGKSLSGGLLPEPSSIALLALSAIGVLGRRRRKSTQPA